MEGTAGEPVLTPGTPALPLLFGPYERRGPVTRYRDRWRCTARDLRLQRTLTLTLRPIGSAPALDGATRTRCLAAFGHPAVATVYDVGRQGDWAFVASEHLGGLGFPMWRRAADRSWRDVVGVVSSALGILLALERSSAGSPERGSQGTLRLAVDDIFIDPHGRVRLADLDDTPLAGGERAHVLEVLHVLQDALSEVHPRPPRWLRTWIDVPEAAASRWPTRAALAHALVAGSEPPKARAGRGLKHLVFTLATSLLWSPQAHLPACPTTDAEATLRLRLDALRPTLGAEVDTHGTWILLADEITAWQLDQAAHQTSLDHDERRHDCLAARAAELETWLELWPSDAAWIRAAAPRAITELGEHALCTAAPEHPPMRDGPVATLVRRALARARVLASLGRTDEALGLATAVRAAALHVDSPRLAAEGRWTLGLVHAARGELVAAQAHLEDALWVAEAIQHASLAAEVTEALVRTSAHRPALREAWLRHARAARVSAPDAPDTPDVSRRRLALALEEARHALAGGDPSDAQVQLESVLQRYASRPGNTLQLAEVHGELVSLATRRGDFEAAFAHVHASRMLLELRLGLAHPRLAQADLLAAELARAQGRFTEALAHLARGRERVSGPAGPLDALDPALEWALGRALAETQHASGDVEGARRTWATFATQSGGPAGAEAAFQHAELLRSAGDFEAAHAGYAQALERWERALGPNHPDLAYALTGWGALELQRGRIPAAVAVLERAVQLRSVRGLAPELVAVTQFTLARALARQHPGDLRAHELAVTAAQAFRGRDPDRYGEVARWLARARDRARRDASPAPLRRTAAHRRRGRAARRSPPAARAAEP